MASQRARSLKIIPMYFYVKMHVELKKTRFRLGDSQDYTTATDNIQWTLCGWGGSTTGLDNVDICSYNVNYRKYMKGWNIKVA